MSNDNKTLADVQPGGMVRLGDGLLPCPFCGAPAERIDFGIGSGENEGGSCIACTVCQHSGPIEFGFKENFVSNWNRRALSAQPSPGGQHGVWMLPDDARIVGVIADSIERGKLDHPGFYRNTQLGEVLRRVLSAALAARQPVGEPVGEAQPGNRVGMLEAACGPDRKFDPAAADAELASIPLVPLWDLPELHPRRVADECLTTMEQVRQGTKPDTSRRHKLTEAIVLTKRFIEQQERSERLGTAPPAQQPARVYLDGLDRALGEAIDQRDRYHEVADELADQIARITGVDIGEHSSANFPWQNAIEAAEEYKPAQAVDLEQFRPAVCAMGLYAEEPEDVDEAKRLLALIDSQAVGK
ncbi:hypothetical protein [Stenotrophomonas maltophilia]|uniref:hypothetical protein n=1 Tax=Stenotrophomonas maltophilia TaxID=40324 RepID=UPI001FA7B066|nr:hypothetical protein [Stenotrophomonas maltophilia]